MLILYSFHIGTSLQGSLYCFLNNSIFQNEFFASALIPSYTILLSKDVEINIKPCEITTKKCNSANNSLKNCKKERLLLSQKAFLFGGERKALSFDASLKLTEKAEKGKPFTYIREKYRKHLLGFRCLVRHYAALIALRCENPCGPPQDVLLCRWCFCRSAKGAAQNGRRWAYTTRKGVKRCDLR